MSARNSLAGISLDTSEQEQTSKSRTLSTIPLEPSHEQIVEYFQKIQNENQNSKSKEISTQICGDVVESVCKRIMINRINVFDKPNDVSVGESSFYTSIHPNELIEQNINKFKLKEQLRVKQVLEDKMRFLDQDISKIKYDMNTPKSKNPTREIKELTEEEKQEKMEFIKSIAKERKGMEKKRQQRLEEIEEQYQLEQQRKLQTENYEKKQKEIQKKKELESRLEDIKKSMVEREEKIKQENITLQKVKSHQPLFEKLQQTDVITEQQTLENKKKRLQEIRDLHKPINPEELKEHEKKFYDNLRALSEKASSNKDKFQYKRPFVSEAYKKIEEQRKLQLEILKHPEEEEKKKGPNLFQKIQEYSKKNLKKPKVDPAKAQEMQKIIEGLSHKPNFKWFTEKKREKSDSMPSKQIESKVSENGDSHLAKTSNTNDTPRRLGNDYLIKLKEKRSRNASEVNQVVSNKDKSDNLDQLENTPSTRVRKMNGKKLSEQQFHTRKGENHDQLSSTNASALIPIKIDYLKELRVHNRGSKQQSELDRIMKHSPHLNSNQKANQLLIHAQKLEQQALRKEQLLRARGNNYSEDESNLDSQILDTYINAIKSKFALLETHS